MRINIFEGILIPFVGTTLGAACVFFMRKTLSKLLQRALAGFAAGIMVAASIWSLLIPAIKQSENMGTLSFVPAVAGFWIGILFLLALDHLIPHLHVGSDQAEGPKSKLGRTTMMVLAVTFYMTPEDVLQFHNLVYSYRDAAYKYGLWTAAGIMMEAGCSDDSFSDFRMWLIAQGKEVYLNALKDPDSLSGVTPYGYCSFEALGYISSQVYSAMKGKNIYQDSTARMQMECYEQVIRDVVYHPMIEYPLELPEAMVVYPKLCECHLSEQVRKAPQKVRTWNVSRTDIRRMMARGNAAIKKMQEQGQNTPEATRPVRKGTVR